MTGPPDALPARLVQFCRLLRGRELVVTPGRAIDAARSVQLIDAADRTTFHAALRANLTVSVDEYPAFDEAFDEFWGAGGGGDEVATGADLQPTVRGLERPPEVVFLQSPLATAGVDADGDAVLPGGERSASDRDLTIAKDFAAFTAEDVVRARRLIRQLTPALATVPSRRVRPAATGGRVDIRRTVRAAARHGGEVVELARQRRKLRKLRVVALCDVSGSMDVYSNYLLQFLYALQNEAGGVRTFVFSTRLHDVTHVLKRKRWDEALAAIAVAVDTWSGGTTIGQCLGEFNMRWARGVVSPRTVVIIASDGWERGDPARLAREMATLQRRVYRIIWLNPLKGHDRYEPLAAGMAAALPYVDHFLAANSIASLERLKRTLSSLS